MAGLNISRDRAHERLLFSFYEIFDIRLKVSGPIGQEAGLDLNGKYLGQ